MSPPAATFVVVCAGFAAGALNAVAGGGSFLTFPALLLLGVPAVRANATSTLALWPGSLGAALGFRAALAGRGRAVLALGGVSLLGGSLGAWLLVRTPEAAFARAVPYLLLVASLLFTWGSRLVRPRSAGAAWWVVGLGGQALIAVYGGYFGGGAGILMLALYAVMGLGDVHAMNGIKAVMAVLFNGLAAGLFAASGLVDWRVGGWMAAAAAAGGVLGARATQRVPAAWVRRLILAVGWGMTAYFFVRPV